MLSYSFVIQSSLWNFKNQALFQRGFYQVNVFFFNNEFFRITKSSHQELRRVLTNHFSYKILEKEFIFSRVLGILLKLNSFTDIFAELSFWYQGASILENMFWSLLLKNMNSNICIKHVKETVFLLVASD